jgi:ADP-ribose pyrophosphatase YjhB (NUDIX family)
MGVPNVTRPCAFVFLRSGERVLVSKMVDDRHGTFYRPPGGGIEFGEHSRETVVRELREEFGLAIDRDDLTLLGVAENAFEFRGDAHHEICFIYEAVVERAVLDSLDGTSVGDLAPDDVEVARVVGRTELLGLEPLYPEGVRDMLVATAGGAATPPT